MACENIRQEWQDAQDALDQSLAERAVADAASAEADAEAVARRQVAAEKDAEVGERASYSAELYQAWLRCVTGNEEPEPTGRR